MAMKHCACGFTGALGLMWWLGGLNGGLVQMWRTVGVFGKDGSHASGDSTPRGTNGNEVGASIDGRSPRRPYARAAMAASKRAMVAAPDEVRRGERR